MSQEQKEPLQQENKNLTKVERKQEKHSKALTAFNLQEQSKLRPGEECGMVMERSATDLLMLFVFVVFVGSMAGLTGYAFVKGDAKKLFYPVVSMDTLNGATLKICGVDGDLVGYQNLYISDLAPKLNPSLTDLFNTGVCVKKCPNASTGQTLDCAPSQQGICDKITPGDKYDTTDILNYCVPSHFGDLPEKYQVGWNQVNKQLHEGQSGRFLKDLQTAKCAVLICAGLAFVYSTLYLYAMSRFANALAMIALLIVEAGIFGGAGMLFFLRGQPNVSDSDKRAYLWVACSLLVFGLLYNMVLWCYWTTMKIAIALVDATADFFAATKRVIFVSCFYFFVTLIVTLFWLVGMSLVAALNPIVPQTVTQIKDVQWTSKTIAMECFMVFGLVWIVFFIQDKTGFITMVAASSFYFSSSKNGEGSGSVMTGVKFAYFKHAGSLAFGSLVQTIVWVIKQIVEGIASEAQRNGGGGAAAAVACCVKCVVGCLENMVDYINKGAYAYIAVTGDSYCRSAWNGFLLNLRHTMQFYYANGLAAMFILMGKLMITCLNVASCFLIMRYGTNKGENNGFAAPLAVVGILSFLTATIFLGQFDEATNATIHCLAVDLDLHDGVPRFGPPSFHEKLAHIYVADKSDGASYKKVADAHSAPPGTGAGQVANQIA